MISSVPSVPARVCRILPVSVAITETGAWMPKVTHTRFPATTSRRGSVAGPLFSPYRLPIHWSIGCRHNTTPLNASRAVSVQWQGRYGVNVLPSSKM